MRFPHIAARVFDTPLLIQPAKLRAVLSVLGPRLGFEVQGGAPQPKVYDDGESRGGTRYRNYQVTDGVAVLPIIGDLVHRIVTLEDACEGFTAYVDITRDFRAALADPEVRSIVFDIDSSGGEVSGVFDLADEIYAARGVKPMTAVVDDLALSGGYLIASAADEVVTTQTGWTGSVGVVWTHIDVSGANQALGIAVTHIYAGEHKIDGTPFAPLGDEVKDSFQAKVDRTYGLFVDAVARNRGMSREAVIATQAEVYPGELGVSIGFADRVGTLKETLNTMAERPAPSSVGMRGSSRAGTALKSETTMSKQGPAGAEAAEQFTAADIEAARKESGAQASTAERDRIRAITGSEEAKGRADLAAHLAYETDMTADAAKALLAKAPTEAKTEAAHGFVAAMGRTPNPQVGADAGAAGDDQADPVNRIVSNYRAVAGHPPKAA